MSNIILKNVPIVKSDWSISDVATKCTPCGWEKLFKDAIPEVEDISRIITQQEQKNGPSFPLKQDVFKAFNLTPLNSVKVVIIGQDPYPQTLSNGLPRDVGLSFSVRKYDIIPSSLKNIYKEIARSSHGFRTPSHGDLTAWATQGVLMLNNCLTIKPGNPNSHGGIWMGFIEKVIRAIEEVNPNCIYVMWGKKAQGILPNLSDHAIKLISSHPSGFSASRGFNGCNHFVMINEALIKQGKQVIDWNVDYA
jgi:uracil-DNA glycosylase